MSGFREPCSGSSVTVLLLMTRPRSPFSASSKGASLVMVMRSARSPNLERDVDHRREVHLQPVIFSRTNVPEPRTLHGQTIRAGIEKQESILPGFIGLGPEAPHQSGC